MFQGLTRLMNGETNSEWRQSTVRKYDVLPTFIVTKKFVNSLYSLLFLLILQDKRKNYNIYDVYLKCITILIPQLQ